MNRGYLSNANQGASRNKNKWLDYICVNIQKLKKGKNEIEWTILVMSAEVVDLAMRFLNFAL